MHRFGSLRALWEGDRKGEEASEGQGKGKGRHANGLEPLLPVALRLLPTAEL
jgi:hypothetical protein